MTEPLWPLLPPPYRADGKIHACPYGRALALCGYPDSQQQCDLDTADRFPLYPVEDQCPTCAEMVAAGDLNPREPTA